MKLRATLFVLPAVLAVGCASATGTPSVAWTGAPTSQAGSPSAAPTATDSMAAGTDNPAAVQFFTQFGAEPAPFHVHLETTLSGNPSGTAVEDADVDGRSYSAQLHVELQGLSPQDSQVIYVEGTGYVADAGGSNWQAYPNYDTVPPIDPFIDFDATQWSDMGIDVSHGSLDRIHSMTWQLPPESPSAVRLADVSFDVWLDSTGLPVNAQLSFELAAVNGAAPVSYAAAYQFTNVGQPVSIVAPSVAPSEVGNVDFTVSSSAFSAGGSIPSQYTCDGANQSLPIAWSNLPQGTVELALVMEDPDARDFVHWVVVGIPPTAAGLGGGAPLPAGAREGKNGFGKLGYGGPCPPSGMHHYAITLYALSAPLSVSAAPTADEVDRAATGITLATATLNGTYKRGG